MKVELYVPDKVAEQLGSNEHMRALLKHAGGGTLLKGEGLYFADDGSFVSEAVGVHVYYTDAEGAKLAYAFADDMLAAGEEAVLIAIDGEPEFIRA